MTDEAAPEAEQPTVPALHLVEAAPEEAPEPVAEAPTEETIEAVGNATITITAEGAGQIFKGQLIGGIEQTYAEGESLTVPAPVADAHIARGFAVEA